MDRDEAMRLLRGAEGGEDLTARDERIANAGMLVQSVGGAGDGDCLRD
jgi:hypothetical protein